MRQHFKDVLVGKEAGERRGMTPDELEIWTRSHGAGAAAWLIFKYRRHIHRRGAVEFTLKQHEKMPNWMQVALEALRKRPGWKVVPMGLPSARKRAWVVRWTKWGAFRAPENHVGL